MKYFLIVFSILYLTVTSCSSRTSAISSSEGIDQKGYLGESDKYVFYSNFWVNMHHFLYNKSLALKEQSVDEAMGDIWLTMAEDEKRIMQNVLGFYLDSLTQYDLRTGEVNFYLKRWCINFSEEVDLPKFEVHEILGQFMNRAKPIYLKYFWEAHNATNKKVLEENIPLVLKHEKEMASQMEALTKEEWVDDKIRVDISFHSKLERPYTTTHQAVHVVMDSGNNATPPGNWLELLFHETSHHLITSRESYVGDLISEVEKEIGMEAPRSLWHAYLFYFTGYVTQDLLQKDGLLDYELYMVRNRPFHWVYPELKKYLPAYISGERDLKQCTVDIIQTWHQRREKNKN